MKIYKIYNTFTEKWEGVNYTSVKEDYKAKTFSNITKAFKYLEDFFPIIPFDNSNQFEIVEFELVEKRRIIWNF